MHRPWLTAYSVVVTLVLVGGVVGCASGARSNGGADPAGSGGARAVTIYSSLPLQGASRPIGEALANGMRLAFDQAGYEAGGVEIAYVPLDDARAETGAWDPLVEARNAERAGADASAVAYLGPYNSGAAAVALPRLNEAGLVMLSPGSTAVGLTTDEPGADAGESQRYYPTGVRTYARIVPRDTIQGAAIATAMADDGCSRVAIRHDEELYGVGLARTIELSAQDLDLLVVSNEGIEATTADHAAEAAAMAAADIDCFVFAGITANGAVPLFTEVSAARPEARLYGTDGLAESTFYDPAEGGLSTSVADKVTLTVAAVAPDDRSAAGRQFFADYEAAYGDPAPNPFAIYGYEAARLILDVLARAEDPTDRESVRRALFETTDRESVLGTYSIDANGDTTLTTYGVHRIDAGTLTFTRAVPAS